VKVAHRKSGFTLVEMLVVISILGILAGLTVPALKNIGKSDASISASQQLLDGVARARQLAMANRTTVYMVFVPTNFWGNLNYNSSATYTTWMNNLTTAQKNAVTNLCDKQLTGYNFISYGALGDQPGQHNWHYLASWQNLPDGTFIAPQKFGSPYPPNNLVSSSATPLFQQWNQDYPHSDGNRIYTFTNGVSLPFPTEDVTPSAYISMPYIAFNYLGQLTFDGQTLASRDEYIPLAQGSVVPAIDAATKSLQLNSPSVLETPPGNSTNISYNIVHIDALTGRAVLEHHKVQ
jgi:prepilin-type N-terminal cleavage/methylation domain-containing protein